jgi:hypothetical protein
MRGRRGGVTAIAAGATPRGKMHGVLAGHVGREMALDHGVVGRARRTAGEGVGVGMAVMGGPACWYATANDMADGLGAGVGVVRVRVGGGDGLVGGCRGHGTCRGDWLAVHCLVADLGVGVRNGLGLDLGWVLWDRLVLVLMLMRVLMLVLVLHLVLGNGWHRHRRAHVHVESWRSGSVVNG